MNTQKREYVALGVIMIIFLVFLGNSLHQSRIAVRDDLRRQDITNLKRALEQYNNARNSYPTPPPEEDSCTATSDKSSWLFGSQSPLLNEQFIDAIPHDVRESSDRSYRYCVTEKQNGQAVGYFLEARLEVPQDNMIGFDEDEMRKFDYRIVNESNKTLYRVCGGTDTQCKPS